MGRRGGNPERVEGGGCTEDASKHGRRFVSGFSVLPNLFCGMFRLTLHLVEVVGFFFSGNQTQAAAPSLLRLLSRSIALQHKHRHTERRRQKTKRRVHHRLKLDTQFLYCREWDLPYQLTRTTSPQVPDFPPSSVLFYVSNFCSSSKKPQNYTKS